jgi:hypothetical protein
LGLNHAGILPKPPLWDRARLQAPFEEDEIDPELAGIQPTIIREDGLEALGVTAGKVDNMSALISRTSPLMMIKSRALQDGRIAIDLVALNLKEGSDPSYHFVRT